nr:hypothetical protein [Bradyrhizobium sp. 2S1]MCK7671495.1 hypothetical protein [Bradyrhizobium sp. 2S1]
MVTDAPTSITGKPMTLAEYYAVAYPDVSPSGADQQFADKIGVARWSVTRYRKFLHYPTPTVWARIKNATKGLVTADDHLPAIAKTQPAMAARSKPAQKRGKAAAKKRAKR